VAESRAVVWLANGTLVDLGHLDNPGHTHATAVNDKNIIVGYSLRDIGGPVIPIVTTHGFRRMPNGAKLVLSPGLDQSFAYDINNRGKIVGSAGPVGSVHAYLWSLSGAGVDLGTFGRCVGRSVRHLRRGRRRWYQ
jgi:probable HAF family extracellular repeat protein